MTRKEEIKEMAKVKASHITSDKDMQVAFADALRSGAEWADRTMIEKACEWLKSNLCEHYADEPIAHKMGRPISGYISFFEEPPVGVIANFRKAMESSSSEIPNNCEKGGE